MTTPLPTALDYALVDGVSRHDVIHKYRARLLPLSIDPRNSLIVVLKIPGNPEPNDVSA